MYTSRDQTRERPSPEKSDVTCDERHSVRCASGWAIQCTVSFFSAFVIVTSHTQLTGHSSHDTPPPRSHMSHTHTPHGPRAELSLRGLLSLMSALSRPPPSPKGFCALTAPPHALTVWSLHSLLHSLLPQLLAPAVREGIREREKAQRRPWKAMEGHGRPWRASE